MAYSVADERCAMQLAHAIESIDEIVFSHRPTWTSILTLDSPKRPRIADYHSIKDQYRVYIYDMTTRLVNLAMSQASAVGRLLTIHDVVWGVAMHEVRHRLQFHMLGELRRWEADVEEDADTIEKEALRQLPTLASVRELADLIWLEP